LALDLLVALVATSLLRARPGYGAGRIVHWAAYACWPVALLHGLGTGSDTKMGWVLGLDLVCAGAVLAALWCRLAQGGTEHGAKVVSAVGTARCSLPKSHRSSFTWVCAPRVGARPPAQP
jgi:predicted outer membrane lipoprotein